MRVTHAGLAFVLVAAAAPAAHAEKVMEKEELVLNVGALLQPQALVEEAAAPNGSAGTDFFLRRARLMLYGNLTKRVSFFVETEQANLGKDGDWSSSIFLLDAFASVETVPGVFIDAGLMLVPFTRHDLQGATSLNGLDYHGALIKFPTGSQRVWRDVGVQGRASLADNHVVLRGGIFNGVEGVLADEDTGTMMRNDADLPRAAAHARYVVVGKEDGFFLPGIRFAEEPTVSFGVGVDWQKGAIPNMDDPRDHLGLAADAFAEIPVVPEQAVIAQATFVRYDDGNGAATTGLGGFVELGYRIGRFEPTVAADVFRADAPDDAGDLTGFHVGGAAFLDKHKANLKLDLARIEAGAAGAKLVGTLQAQLLF
jgi:hypothetical protein